MALVAIVGRPNVGKSTLFNRMSRTNTALVDDFPGVTRDRNYVAVTYDEKRFTLVDTGGFVSLEENVLDERMREQIRLALDEADIIVFVADGKTGLHPEDATLVDMVRRTAKPVFYAVNKIDGPEQRRNLADFYELGVEPLYPISSAHGLGIDDLMDDIVAMIPEPAVSLEEEPSEIRVSIVGRPNAGKSTLVNGILGTERVIVSPIPGTTRDAIDSPITRNGQRYLLIDTAGIRRKGRTHEKLEKLSIMRALHSVDRSHVVLLLLDAVEGITDQDMHIAGYVQERYRCCIVGINKWDAIEEDQRRGKQLMEEVRYRFRFMPFAPIITLSALSGKRVAKIIPAVADVFGQYNRRVTTGILNRTFEQIVSQHEPPSMGNRRLRFYYATQSAVRPPTFVLFCNRPEAVHFSYQRYLTNQFREAFDLQKTPLRLVFRGRSGREEKGE